MNDPLVLETRRLRLVRSTFQQLQKLIEGAEAFTAVFQHAVIDGYRGFPEALGYSLAKLTESHPDCSWWAPFLLIGQQDDAMVGLGGFVGPPDASGMVEFGYAIAPTCRGIGLATEAATALIQYAFDTGRVTVVRAHTLPNVNGSARVLEKCGFKQVGTSTDPDEGEVWRWEKAR